MNKENQHKWTLTFDGGASPNPGIASCAFKAVNELGDEIKLSWRMDGIRTNNEAEWEAVATGIESIMEYDNDAVSIIIIGDSLLVINQLSGIYRIRDFKLRSYFDRIQNVKLQQGVAYFFYHVKREYNTEMDIACKEARNNENVMTA